MVVAAEAYSQTRCRMPRKLQHLVQGRSGGHAPSYGIVLTRLPDDQTGYTCMAKSNRSYHFWQLQLHVVKLKGIAQYQAVTWHVKRAV